MDVNLQSIFGFLIILTLRIIVSSIGKIHDAALRASWPIESGILQSLDGIETYSLFTTSFKSHLLTSS